MVDEGKMAWDDPVTKYVPEFQLKPRAPKSGDKTPGVQRQYCGEMGKVENCIVGQHLLYTDNDEAIERRIL